jgi:hypothetical protein
MIGSMVCRILSIIDNLVYALDVSLLIADQEWTKSRIMNQANKFIIPSRAELASSFYVQN